MASAMLSAPSSIAFASPRLLDVGGIIASSSSSSGRTASRAHIAGKSHCSLQPPTYLAAILAASSLSLSTSKRLRRRQQTRLGTSRRVATTGVSTSRRSREDLWHTTPLVPIDLPALTAEERRSLLAGERVQRQTRIKKQGQGIVVFDVRAPASLVLNCLNAFENYPDMIPVVREVEIRGRELVDGYLRQAQCSYRISKFLLTVSVVHRLQKELGLLHFDLDRSVASTMLKDVTGFWHVHSLQDDEHPGGYSRVWLKVNLTAAKWLPHWLIDYASERALSRATAWLKPKVEKLWSDTEKSAS
eukprot:TRINITY_DN36468_c0_g1_i1.p1 TRINITY_DN36468_c0_g1~~TRINITY_DN36468_c0_g1_i1.p1  ORF type:complete len:310 (+),score=39.85 TRINITY_DN36468_c0_g1_i1:27-932(+)